MDQIRKNATKIMMTHSHSIKWQVIFGTNILTASAVHNTHSCSYLLDWNWICYISHRYFIYYLLHWQRLYCENASCVFWVGLVVWKGSWRLILLQLFGWVELICNILEWKVGRQVFVRWILMDESEKNYQVYSDSVAMVAQPRPVQMWLGCVLPKNARMSS